MKKTAPFILSVFLLVLTALAFTPPKSSLVGHWVATFSNGSQAFADFKSNGTYKSYSFQGKVLVTGKYYVAKDTFATQDGSCGIDYFGKYKMTWYGQDSASIAMIEDSCSGRTSAINGGTLKRAKQQ